MKLKHSPLMLAAVSLLVALVTIASAVQYINGFEVYTEEDGLASGTVQRVAIAPDGRKWFSCRDGLTFFDELTPPLSLVPNNQNGLCSLLS